MATQEMTDDNFSENELPSNMDGFDVSEFLNDDNTDTEENMDTPSENKEGDIVSDVTDDEDCEAEKKEEIAVDIANLLQVICFFSIY